ncbi:MAG: glycosyltransferase family 4 protein [Prevotella sp.]|nr:glycosyltransferase family 4 protein [Prevotella sp.]MCM1075042.1 glycosyltransferase family 4 protein [Ruminococcus sp.]
MKLVVGYDGKRAVRNMTGLGNYSRLVLESLAVNYPEMDLRVYAPRDDENPRWQKVRELPNVTLRLPHRGKTPLGGSLWRSCKISKLLKPEGVQLYHGLSNELPLNIPSSGVPAVVTMHDVIYRRLPYCYKPADRLIYDFKYGRSCRQASRIIAVSERTKLDVMEYYDVPESKIDVVYQGCDDIFRELWEAGRLSRLLEKYNLTQPYIIQVGSIERRKNAVLTVRALSALPEEVELVLVGRPTDYLQTVISEADKSGVRHRLKILSNVPFTDLPGLYQGARIAAYPSRYEGFGIPLLEALCSRTPCLAATGSCLEEAGGKGAMYVNPDDVQSAAQILRILLTDESKREELIAEGIKHSSSFKNSDIPGRIMEVYERTLAGV